MRMECEGQRRMWTMEGRRERKEEREETSLSLSRSLDLFNHRGRQMRRTCDRIERGGPCAYVPAYRACVPRTPGWRETQRETEEERRREMHFGERNFEISTNGRRYAEPPRVSLAFRHENRNGRINSGYGDTPLPFPFETTRKDGIFFSVIFVVDAARDDLEIPFVLEYFISGSRIAHARSRVADEQRHCSIRHWISEANKTREICRRKR